jgi:hypothetical protein
MQWIQHFLPLLEAALELAFRHCRGGSAIVYGFQGHPGTIALIAAVSFLETRRNHNGPNKESKEGGGLDFFLVAKSCCTVKTVCTGELSW